MCDHTHVQTQQEVLRLHAILEKLKSLFFLCNLDYQNSVLKENNGRGKGGGGGGG